jgi:outer membrane cobalamin receptor
VEAMTGMMMRRTLSQVLLLIVIGAGPAIAQQRDTTGSDSTQRRTAASRLAPVIVKDSRLVGVDRRTPSRVDDIRLDAGATGSGAAADVLRNLAGVSLFDDQGSRLQPELDLRGFIVSPVVGQPQGVSVFLDGVRVNEPDAQEVDFDLIPMDAVARGDQQRLSGARDDRAFLRRCQRPMLTSLRARCRSTARSCEGARLRRGLRHPTDRPS